MQTEFLYQQLEYDINCQNKTVEIPNFITNSLSKNIRLRNYQQNAIKNFIKYFEDKRFSKNKQIHNLFQMATGSGKTVIMASLILYLYTKGYKRFIFLVNQTNILEKTIDNFMNPLSSKYLFNTNIEYLGNNIEIKQVDNFHDSQLNNDIEIIFKTIQSMHIDLMNTRENSLTLDDFYDNKIVFLADECHHLNTATKAKNKDKDNNKDNDKNLEEELQISWEYSLNNIFTANKDNILLEFTATCQLNLAEVHNKYVDKLIFNYPLLTFRNSGYTKDFMNFATDTDFFTRSLIALVMSEYRKFLFATFNQNIKPVVLFKSKTVSNSKKFYEEFFLKLDKMDSSVLKSLLNFNVPLLKEALNYFLDNDKDLNNLLFSIKNSFTKETSLIVNSKTEGDDKKNQLLLNSLEDRTNPIRLIFVVDMLNEGWDVLNLFDIVRLFDERQGGAKATASTYTMKEAQLIGRGARYCPFIASDNNNSKYRRKYDKDLDNKHRILETLFFHSKNDSKYITELKKALVEAGIQDANTETLTYTLKDDFKESEFYNKTLVFSNKRVEKSRTDVNSIDERVRFKHYTYTVRSNKGKVLNLFDKKNNSSQNPVYDANIVETKSAIYKIKDIPMNILTGAIESFYELNFNYLKSKYPNLTSTKEFLTSDNYLGNVTLEIYYFDEKVKGSDLFNACVYLFSKIVKHLLSLKVEYVGTKEFTSKPMKDVIKDKRIYIRTDLINDIGRGSSQNEIENHQYSINLEKESWYVFNDNYGTSEEKAFIKYFKVHIEPKFKEKNLEFYLIRNERVPELAIYSFDTGERFEPDFLLFVKLSDSNNKIYQSYVEPKGSHLLSTDAWKESFLTQLEDVSNVSSLYGDNYKIIGLPFFNSSKQKLDEFSEAIDRWLSKL